DGSAGLGISGEPHPWGSHRECRATIASEEGPMKPTLVVSLAAGLLFAIATSVFGQATATITGRVVDQGSLVLPGVAIVATNTATGASRETTTNEIGVYTIPALPPGTYDVRAEIAGFAPQRRQIALVTNSTLTVNYEL